jgi:hypothetical protein
MADFPFTGLMELWGIHVEISRNNARLQDLKEEMKNKTVHNEMI